LFEDTKLIAGAILFVLLVNKSGKPGIRGAGVVVTEEEIEEGSGRDSLVEEVGNWIEGGGAEEAIVRLDKECAEGVDVDEDKDEDDDEGVEEERLLIDSARAILNSSSSSSLSLLMTIGSLGNPALPETGG